MAVVRAEDIYRRHIKPLPPDVRARILELIGHDLASNGEAVCARPKRSIMELRGLGKEIWEGVDPQEYVDRLRAEWDGRL